MRMVVNGVSRVRLRYGPRGPQQKYTQAGNPSATNSGAVVSSGIGMSVKPFLAHRQQLSWPLHAIKRGREQRHIHGVLAVRGQVGQVWLQYRPERLGERRDVIPIAECVRIEPRRGGEAVPRRQHGVVNYKRE